MSYRFLLNHLLESSAESYPDRTAVVDRDRSISYGELETSANRLAHLLIDQGARPGDRIGIYMDKSLEAVLGIYAVLKAGCAYVPLDARAPSPRVGYIAADCGIRHLLSSSKEPARWQELGREGARLERIYVLDRDQVSDLSAPDGTRLLGRQALGSMPESPPEVRVIGQDLAYLLYTSGSTGRPKGVMLSHLNGLSFVNWAIEELEVGHEDRLSSHAPLHFDLSIFDIFAASGAGASVSLVPHGISVFPIEVAKFITSRQISIWYSVPSILSMLTEHGELSGHDFPSLRHVVFAGEVFPSKYLSRLMKLLPRARFHNWYGPTETNVCTAFQVGEPPAEDGRDIPIGAAIANVETFVLTERGQRGGVGHVGELFVRGPTVMRGYWGDPEKTAERLVPNPLEARGGELVYRTGDLVEEEPGGNYRFLGRKDHQIKSRGYRIELGEIESALHAHPEVLECAVVAIPDEMISNRIKAYVTARPGVSQADLVAFCGDRLPRYMIPEEMEFRETLPKTSTGKIDRQALSPSV